MSETKKKYESFVTPRAVASWPHLNSPDTKYKAEGEFHTKLLFDTNKPEHAAFLAFLQERLDSHIEELKETLSGKALKTLVVNDIVKDELDKEGDETGLKVVSFKMYALSTDKKTKEVKKREPRFFDAKGTKLVLANVPKLSGGSELKVEYSISGYSTPKGSGITLYLSNVQIIKAVVYSGSESKFGDEGDGFAAPEGEEREAMTDETAGADDPTDGDF